MLRGSMDQHRDQQARQQQQCNAYKNDQHFACIPRRAMVMTLFHMTFLSLVESQQTLLRHSTDPISEDLRDYEGGGAHGYYSIRAAPGNQ